MPSTPSATAPMDVDFVIVAIVIADDGGRTRLGLSGGGLVQGEENRDRIEEGEGRMDLIGVGLRNRRIKLGERERERDGWELGFDSFFLSFFLFPCGCIGLSGERERETGGVRSSRIWKNVSVGSRR